MSVCVGVRVGVLDTPREEEHSATFFSAQSFHTTLYHHQHHRPGSEVLLSNYHSCPARRF